MQIRASQQSMLAIDCADFGVDSLSRCCPRDALLARVLAMALCLSVCLSVTGRFSIEMDGQIALVLLHGSFLRPVLHSIVRKFIGAFKNKGTSLWNFAPNSGLRKFRHGISIVERVINLARER